MRCTWGQAFDETQICLPNKLALYPLPSNGSQNLSTAATFFSFGDTFHLWLWLCLSQSIAKLVPGLQLAASSIPHFNACCPVGRWYGPITLFFVHKSMKSFTQTQF